MPPVGFVVKPDPRVGHEFYDLLERLHISQDDESPHDLSHENVTIVLDARCVSTWMLNAHAQIAIRIMELKVTGTESHREVLYFGERVDYDLDNEVLDDSLAARQFGYGRLNLTQPENSSLVLCISDGHAYDGYHQLEYAR